MPQFIHRYATPLITGLFIVSLISGIALFFHVGPSGFHGMHEWLSMVLIVPFVLHLWKNWKVFLRYFSRGPMAVALVASVLVAVVFLYPAESSGGSAGGPPQFQLARRVMSQPLNVVAPALGTTPDALTASLATAGFTVTSADQKLSEIKAASGKSDGEMAAALLSMNR